MGNTYRDAAYFKTTIFVAQKFNSSGVYNWKVIKPLLADVSYPVVPRDDPGIPDITSVTYTHIEITYENAHFNSLVGLDGKRTVLMPEPQIRRAMTDCTTVLNIT